MSYNTLLSCLISLRDAPKHGTLYEYSERLVDIALEHYPGHYPYFISKRISSLVNARQQETQLSLF